jgi:exodeoxyribonuclease I
LTNTFYWHDYETWGADPRRDRPCQFAGWRTDEELRPVGQPRILYCRPADDVLPHPDACLLTGITPQHAWSQGFPEAEFAAAIEQELAQPGTCGVGYNSIHFDDEITRNLFYRNFIDPYAREWQHGNSRWDLIDVLRLAHALRPGGIQWPVNAEGVTSFRLEHLTVANGIEHSHAHDALADVRATIALAALLKTHQPRLFAYALSLRRRDRVEEMFARGQPFLHVSRRYPALWGCIAPVLPIVRHPLIGNGMICFDLRYDPAPLMSLSVEAIRERLFTPVKDLPQGIERIPLKTIHANRAPMVAPMATLTAPLAESWAIDLALVDRHAKLLAAAPDLGPKVRQLFQNGEWPVETDPDLMLYTGGFFSDTDRRLMARLRQLPPRDLATASFPFQDRRLKTLLFRYRARNWPETLSQEERRDWDAWRHQRLTDPAGGASITLAAFRERLAVLRAEHEGCPPQLALINELASWVDRIGAPGD